MKNDGRKLILNDHHSLLVSCGSVFIFGLKKKFSISSFPGLVLYSTSLLKAKLLRICITIETVVSRFLHQQ